MTEEEVVTTEEETTAAEEASAEESTGTEESAGTEEQIVIEVNWPEEPMAVTVVDERPFLSTPLDDYSVTEGLLMVIAVILILNAVGRLLKEGFSWLA